MSRRLGDFALAAVGVLVSVQGGVCGEARIALAGVGVTPLRAPGAEALLRGQKLTDEALQAAAAHAATECDPPADIHASAELRRHLVSVLTRRALAAAVQRAA
jgi:carbon-monoxide dehydrogenase medium subunit